MMFFLRFLLITTVTVTTASLKPTRYDLAHYLLRESNYDHSFPPDTNNITNVSVQLDITDLNSESDKDREIEFSLYLRMNWTDRRLDFTENKTTYDIIPLGDDIVNSLWIPDLYFIEERNSLLHGLLTSNQLAFIHKNGDVFYSGRFDIKAHCVMSFKKYPFDEQSCEISIQSYALTTDYLLLHWVGKNAVDIACNEDTLIFEDAPQSKATEYRNNYPYVGSFSTLSTSIRFKRPRGSYFTMVVVPPVFVVIIALTSFLLGENVSPRITIPTGALTQLFVNWAGVHNRLSFDSTMDLFDAWMIGNISFVGFILFVNAMICHCKYKKKPPDDKVMQSKEKSEKDPGDQMKKIRNNQVQETNFIKSASGQRDRYRERDCGNQEMVQQEDKEKKATDSVIGNESSETEGGDCEDQDMKEGTCCNLKDKYRKVIDHCNTVNTWWCVVILVSYTAFTMIIYFGVWK